MQFDFTAKFVKLNFLTSKLFSWKNSKNQVTQLFLTLISRKNSWNWILLLFSKLFPWKFVKLSYVTQLFLKLISQKKSWNWSMLLFSKLFSRKNYYNQIMQLFLKLISRKNWICNFFKVVFTQKFVKLSQATFLAFNFTKKKTFFTLSVHFHQFF